MIVTETTREIARLNDIVRMNLFSPVMELLIPRQIMLTGGIASLPESFKTMVLQRVRDFSAFTSDNDPHGEHDCALFTIGTRRVMFKFDYYAISDGVVDWDHGSEAPEDPQKTMRVLTVMLGEEY